MIIKSSQYTREIQGIIADHKHKHCPPKTQHQNLIKEREGGKTGIPQTFVDKKRGHCEYSPPKR